MDKFTLFKAGRIFDSPNIKYLWSNWKWLKTSAKCPGLWRVSTIRYANALNRTVCTVQCFSHLICVRACMESTSIHNFYKRPIRVIIQSIPCYSTAVRDSKATECICVCVCYWNCINRVELNVCWCIVCNVLVVLNAILCSFV